MWNIHHNSWLTPSKRQGRPLDAHHHWRVVGLSHNTMHREVSIDLYIAASKWHQKKQSVKSQSTGLEVGKLMRRNTGTTVLVRLTLICLFRGKGWENWLRTDCDWHGRPIIWSAFWASNSRLPVEVKAWGCVAHGPVGSAWRWCWQQPWGLGCKVLQGGGPQSGQASFWWGYGDSGWYTHAPWDSEGMTTTVFQHQIHFAGCNLGKDGVTEKHPVSASRGMHTY